MTPRYRLTNVNGVLLFDHPGYHAWESANENAWALVTLGDQREVQVREISTNEVITHLISPKGKKQ
jgi:hypothetical protein